MNLKFIVVILSCLILVYTQNGYVLAHGDMPETIHHISSGKRFKDNDVFLGKEKQNSLLDSAKTALKAVTQAEEEAIIMQAPPRRKREIFVAKLQKIATKEFIEAYLEAWDNQSLGITFVIETMGRGTIISCGEKAGEVDVMVEGKLNDESGSTPYATIFRLQMVNLRGEWFLNQIINKSN